MKQNSAINKAIIFDSGTLISFAISGLLNEFRELKKIFGGKFLITKQVMAEVVDKPLQIKRFELEALKINELVTDKVLELPAEFGIDDKTIAKMTDNILNVANNTFYGHGNAMQIIHLGETSCLALSTLLNERKIENVISVDERTVRMLCEKPENLSLLFQKKLHTDINAKKENFSFFAKFRFIRSTELVYIAYKKGIVKLKNPKILDALLYAMKFNGCAISDEEILEIEKMG